MREFSYKVCTSAYDGSKDASEHDIYPDTVWKDISANWACFEHVIVKVDSEMVKIV